MKLEQLDHLLNEDKEKLRHFVKRVCKSNQNIYISDLYILGAIKRNYGNINGLKLLINSKNMNASRSLLRVHLDTVLRFQALWLVENIDDAIEKILNGISVSKLKDKLGNKLTDSYLADILNEKNPWVKNVYKNLCSYIHFSNAHIWDGIDLRKFKDREFTFQITEQDLKYPEWSWEEVLECTHNINIIFQNYLESYLLSRN